MHYDRLETIQNFRLPIEKIEKFTSVVELKSQKIKQHAIVYIYIAGIHICIQFS